MTSGVKIRVGLLAAQPRSHALSPRQPAPRRRGGLVAAPSPACCCCCKCTLSSSIHRARPAGMRQGGKTVGWGQGGHPARPSPARTPRRVRRHTTRQVTRAPARTWTSTSIVQPRGRTEGGVGRGRTGRPACGALATGPTALRPAAHAIPHSSDGTALLVNLTYTRTGAESGVVPAADSTRPDSAPPRVWPCTSPGADLISATRPGGGGGGNPRRVTRPGDAARNGTLPPPPLADSAYIPSARCHPAIALQVALPEDDPAAGGWCAGPGRACLLALLVGKRAPHQQTAKARTLADSTQA